MTLALRSQTANFFEMIKISHTLFALPFAVGATFIASRGAPGPLILLKILLAVFFARTAAMSFNRLADRHLDAANPRTADRALPAGRLSARFVALTTLVSLTGFVITCAWIHTTALLLSPVAAAIFLGYSLTKRFTLLSHVVLGSALALAPIGAWLAVTGSFRWEPWVLGAAVLLWTAGFDIIYACLDAEFDLRMGLRSIPARLGIQPSLVVSALLHVAMAGLLFLLWWRSPDFGRAFLVATVIASALLLYEHSIVRPGDLRRVNHAFFTLNGIISFLLMAAMILDALVR